MSINNRPLILIVNDDGYRAGGLRALIEAARPYGDLVVMAPAEGQSGMSHALTVKLPLRVEKYAEESGLAIYVCSGTPVDCVKIALNRYADRRPCLLLTGINHGANSSASVLYSGTMAAAIEGCMHHIPAIGFSLLDSSPEADFTPYTGHVKAIIESVIKDGLHNGDFCLNVNIPCTDEIRGIRVCRQARGHWVENFERRMDPNNLEYYWLAGGFFNDEPDAADTDEWALRHDYISVVPVQVDMTCYKSMDTLGEMFESDSDRQIL